jgi:peptidoglycan-N-acetylglucosamine deacetylase
MSNKPVFFDPTGRRGRLLAWMARSFGAIGAVVIGVFVATLVVVDQPKVDPGTLSAPHPSIRCAWAPTCSPAHAVNVTKVADSELLKTAANLAANLRKEQRALRAKRHQAELIDRRSVPASLAPSGNTPLSIGFYVNWDDNSYPALKRTLPHLDWIIPGWLSLQGTNMELRSDVDSRALNYIQITKPNIPILPMI